MPSRTDIRSEDGFALIEILMSALLLLVVAVGVFTAFDATTRASAEERHRARAHALAEADVARMQAMRIAELAGYTQTRTVTQDGFQYTIDSRAEFVDEPATTSTCATGANSRDYLRIRSTVTWPTIGTRPPVTISSIVSPPNGSIVPNSGAMLVNVTDSRNNGIPGVSVSGSGPGSFSGSTGPTGCVLWRNVPVGNYTLTFAGAASGKVDKDGNPPSARTASVVAQSTNTVNLQYDSPGRIQNIAFMTRPYGNGALIPSSADSIVIDHTSMTTARVLTAPGGTRQAVLATQQNLFPFTTPYAVYAGNCGANNPGSGAALGSATVPVGASTNLASPGYIQLPALHVTVWSGTSGTSPGSRVANARVTARDRGCNVTRVLTTATNSQGQLPVPGDVGLPFGEYDVCANNFNTNGTVNRKRTITAVSVQAAGTTGNVLNIYLGGGTTGGTQC